MLIYIVNHCPEPQQIRVIYRLKYAKLKGIFSKIWINSFHLKKGNFIYDAMRYNYSLYFCLILSTVDQFFLTTGIFKNFNREILKTGELE